MANITESYDDANALQLILAVPVAPNNTDDAVLLTANARPALCAQLHPGGSLLGTAAPSPAGFCRNAGQPKRGGRSHHPVGQTSLPPRESPCTRSLPRHLHGHRIGGHVQVRRIQRSGPNGLFLPLIRPDFALATAVRPLGPPFIGPGSIFRRFLPPPLCRHLDSYFSC